MPKKKHTSVKELYNPCLTPSQKAQARAAMLKSSDEPFEILVRLMTNYEMAILYNRIWDAMTYSNEQIWDLPEEVTSSRPGIKAMQILNREAFRREL